MPINLKFPTVKNTVKNRVLNSIGLLCNSYFSGVQLV